MGRGCLGIGRSGGGGVGARKRGEVRRGVGGVLRVSDGMLVLGSLSGSGTAGGWSGDGDEVGRLII